MIMMIGYSGELFGVFLCREDVGGGKMMEVEGKVVEGKRPGEINGRFEAVNLNVYLICETSLQTLQLVPGLRNKYPTYLN